MNASSSSFPSTSSSSSSASSPSDPLTPDEPVTPAPGAAVPAEGGKRTGNDLVDRVAQSAHATIDRLADGAVPHVEHLQQSLGDTNRMLHERAGQARELSSEWTETLRCSVREHPLAAIGTALALGLLLARLGSTR